MDEVYEVEDEELRTRVALKVVHPEGALDSMPADALRREVELARRIAHPNVCRTYDLGHQAIEGPDGDQDRLTFLTMELLRGETLRDRVARLGRIDVERALPIVRQMAAALDAAH